MDWNQWDRTPHRHRSTANLRIAADADAAVADGADADGDDGEIDGAVAIPKPKDLGEI